MTEETQRPKKGFAGLQSMVSEVNISVQDTKPTEQPTENSTPTRGSPLEFNLPENVPEEPFWKKTWVKWSLGILVLTIIIVAFNDDKKVNSSQSPNSLPSYTSPTAYAPALELQPPVGTDYTLTDDQIRYCLSEKIRLEAWETSVNTYSDFSVNSFNNAVDHFNARCSSYRYRKYAFETVNSQVEAKRTELYAEGLSKAALYSGK